MPKCKICPNTVNNTLVLQEDDRGGRYYQCPHCLQFWMESGAQLKAMTGVSSDGQLGGYDLDLTGISDGEGIIYNSSANKFESSPAGVGDMTKAAYDTNDDGVVDGADDSALLDGSTKAQVQDHTPKSHVLGSHGADTLADLNTIVSDATLDDSGDSRPPTAHASDHTDGTDDIQDASDSQKGLATAAQITKLDGIDPGADVTADNDPKSHASSHQSGGADSIKLDDLAEPDDNTDLDFSTTKHGLVPKGTNIGNFLKDDGTWGASGAGDMLKSVYDTGDNGQCDNADDSDLLEGSTKAQVQDHTPKSHVLGAHGSDTLADINAIISDATLDDSGDSRPPDNHASNHTDGTDDIQDATDSQKGLATSSQITKLDGIDPGADVTGDNSPQAHKDSHDPEDGGDALDTAAASEIAGVQSAGIGTSHSLARADHAHQIQHGITDNHIVTVDDASAADDEYARFTANGLEGRTAAQVRLDINVADGADVTGDNAPQSHNTSHQSGGGDSIKLDDLAEPDDNTDLDFSTTKHGLVPKGTNVGNFLKDDGTWAASGAGDMLKSTYDTGDNGQCDMADDSDLLEGSTKAQVQNHAPQSHKDSHDPEDGGDALDCAAASEIAGVQAAGEGSSHSLARADHAHQIQHGITDNHLVTVDDSAAADDEYARFTANGIEGRTAAQVRSDINVADGADVTGSNAPQAHNTSHQSGGGDAIKLDDLATPDDNTDLDFSTSAHGLCPKGTNTGKFLKDDGTWDTPVAGGGAFEESSSVVQQDTGTAGYDEDFVFGSPQLDDDGDADHDSRFLFDEGKAAFRAGKVSGTDWDNANMGDYSNAFGWNVKASGSYSLAIGVDSDATNNGSVALGQNLQATGDSCFAAGNQNTASATGAAVLGTENTASGSGSFAAGYQCSALDSYASAIGSRAKTSVYGQNARASGYFSEAGDAQTSVCIARIQTTNADVKELALNGAGESQYIDLQSDVSYAFVITIVARRTDSDNESAMYYFRCCADNNAGTSALVGDVVKDVVAEDTAAWDANVTVSDANDRLEIKVTGEVGKTIRWVARVEMTEVKG